MDVSRNIYVGCHVSEHGEPLIVVGGDAITTVEAMEHLLAEYRMAQVRRAVLKAMRQGV